MDVNAWVYDPSYVLQKGATFTVDGTDITASGSQYYKSLTPMWTNGSVHNYSIATADGQTVSGTFTYSTATLSGPSYSPSKVIATSYTVSNPAGNWPADAFVEAIVVNGGGNYSYEAFPMGTAVASFNADKLIGATSVTFRSSLRKVTNIEGYASGSQLRVEGPRTSW